MMMMSSSSSSTSSSVKKNMIGDGRRRRQMNDDDVVVEDHANGTDGKVVAAASAAAARGAERVAVQDGDASVVIDSSIYKEDDGLGEDTNNDGTLKKQFAAAGDHRSVVDEKKVRPSLSYARTIFTAGGNTSQHHQAAATKHHRRRAFIRKKNWTLSYLLWAILSFILMIPILEASLGEVRRRIVTLHILRFNNARYYPRWRHGFRGVGGAGGGGGAMLSSTAASSGRTRNVHNL